VCTRFAALVNPTCFYRSTAPRGAAPRAHPRFIPGSYLVHTWFIPGSYPVPTCFSRSSAPRVAAPRSRPPRPPTLNEFGDSGVIRARGKVVRHPGASRPESSSHPAGADLFWRKCENRRFSHSSDEILAISAVAPIFPISCRSGFLRHGGMADHTTGDSALSATPAPTCRRGRTPSPHPVHTQSTPSPHPVHTQSTPSPHPVHT
jgi:hypothetical protein